MPDLAKVPLVLHSTTVEVQDNDLCKAYVYGATHGEAMPTMDSTQHSTGLRVIKQV